jgi:hypothetical protein
MKRNVAVLVLDCVRKDFFEEYATRLLRMSDVSVDRCYAASSWSTPSHASMFTGELPHRHGVHAHNLDFRNLETDTFLSELEEHTTVGTSTNLFAGPSFGFDHLFDEFWNASRNGVFMGGMNIEEFSQESSTGGIRKYRDFVAEAYRRDCLSRSLLNGASVKLNDAVEAAQMPRLWDYGAGSMIRGSLGRLPSREPFFFFANFMEAHSPYLPSVKYDSSLYDVPSGWSGEAKEWEINKNPDGYTDLVEGRREVYAASVDYLDRRVSSFVERLMEKTEGETTVFVTADHGENLAFESEDFIWGHQGSLSHPLLHVPFAAINLPDGHAEALSGPSFSHLDLGDLVVSVAKGEPAEMQSREYVPAERIGYGPSTEPDDFEYWDRAIRCVYHDGSRYEWDSLGERYEYEIIGDSTEKKVSEDAKIPDEVMEQLDTDIKEYKKKVSGSRAELDDTTKQNLSELGYL